MVHNEVSAADFAAAGSLPEIYALLEKSNMGPGWNKPEPSLWPLPKKTFVPAGWSYQKARAALAAASPHVSTELAERRNLILPNPIPGNHYATARTLIAAYQMVKAGEVARSHRHTPNALRLVVEAAPGTYTLVQGKKIPMSPGDVLLTPNWLWHGHMNESDSNAYWIDFLDAPLVQLLEPMFFEHFPEGIEKPEGVDENSAMRFPHAETMARLDAIRPNAQSDRWEVQLGNPALETIALYVSRHPAGSVVRHDKSTANAVFAVIDGSGQTDIDGEIIEWQRGDVFVAPAWRPYEHRSKTTSHLLRVTDEPVLAKLKLLHPGQ